MMRHFRSGVICALALGAGVWGCGKGTSSTNGGTVVGKTSVSIDTRMVTTRVGEAAVGDYAMDTLVAAMKTAGTPVDVAVTNSGSIRGGAVDPKTFAFLTTQGKLGQVYPAGDVTDVDIQGWFPFHDDTALLTINGTQLKSVLERGVSELPPDLKNDLGGELLQVGGMRYGVDCSGTAQQLSTDKSSVTVEGTRINYIKVGANVIYDPANNINTLSTTPVRVLTNSFVAAGNDGHLAFKSGTALSTLPYASFTWTQQLIADVKAKGSIAPATDGRIKITGTCGQPLTTP